MSSEDKIRGTKDLKKKKVYYLRTWAAIIRSLLFEIFLFLRE